MALGATGGNVGRLVLRQILGLTAIDVGTATVAAFAAGRVLTNLVDGVRAVEVSTFAAAITVLVVAALLAGVAPARRASHVDATMALRQE
jgi:ABC-type antimicrobial peptide transport system permease subunit